MLSAVLVASIAVAVILGYKTKINTGFFCIAFAYLIGCFGMGLKTKELIGFWPVSTMFVILSVSLFYNFAALKRCRPVFSICAASFRACFLLHYFL